MDPDDILALYNKRLKENKESEEKKINNIFDSIISGEYGLVMLLQCIKVDGYDEKNETFTFCLKVKDLGYDLLILILSTISDIVPSSSRRRIRISDDLKMLNLFHLAGYIRAKKNDRYGLYIPRLPYDKMRDLIRVLFSY